MADPTITPTHSSEAPDAFCIACHYPLRRLDPATRNCPECGRPFDPDDPWSMNVARPIPRALRWSLRPVKWLYPTVCAVIVLALLADIAVGGVIRFAWIILGLLWLPVGLAYYLRRNVRRWVVYRYRQNRDFLRGDDVQLTRSRRALALVVLLLFFRFPFKLVFWASLPWLNEIAHREYAVKPWNAPRPEHFMAGLIPVRSVRIQTGGVDFDTWLGSMSYYESNDGRHGWASTLRSEDPLENLPW